MNPNFVTTKYPAALTHILETPLVPWLALWHPATAKVARDNPRAKFFESWCNMLTCLRMAEEVGGEHMVLCARIGPQYGEMPVFDRDHYEDVYEHTQEQRARLLRTWSDVSVAIDTELYAALKKVEFPEEHVAGLQPYDYYKSVYFDGRWPHSWWHRVLGPGGRACQVAPVYHKNWPVPPGGYLIHRYWGAGHGHTKLEEFLAKENCLLSAPSDEEVAWCQQVAEWYRR